MTDEEKKAQEEAAKKIAESAAAAKDSTATDSTATATTVEPVKKADPAAKADDVVTPDGGVATLGKNMTTTEKVGDKLTTTQKGTKVESKQEYTISPFLNPDGTVNTTAKKEFEDTYDKPLRQKYSVDENGKFVDPQGKVIGSLFGFDPEEYAAREREKERLERFKQKEAGWRNALGVITDIVTAGAGGNVYQREKDTVAKTANEAAEKASNNIREMGNAVAKAKRGMEDAYLKEKQADLQQYIKNFGRKVKQSTTQYTTPDVKLEQGGGKIKTVKGTWDQIKGSARSGNNYNIGGKTYAKDTVVRFRNEDGTYTNFTADTMDALAYARLYVQEASKYINNPDNQPVTEKKNIFGKVTREAVENPMYEELYEALVEAGVTDPEMRQLDKKDLTPEQYMMLLQGGYIPTVGGVAEEAKKLYKKSTGKDFTGVNTEWKGFDPDGEKEDESEGTEGGL